MSASGIQNLGLWNPEYPRLCWALLNPLNYVGGFVSEILPKRNKKESQFQKDHTLEISLFRSSLQARKKFQQLTVFLQLKAGQSVALFISLSIFLSKNNNSHACLRPVADETKLPVAREKNFCCQMAQKLAVSCQKLQSISNLSISAGLHGIYPASRVASIFPR